MEFRTLYTRESGQKQLPKINVLVFVFITYKNDKLNDSVSAYLYTCIYW